MEDGGVLLFGVRRSSSLLLLLLPLWVSLSHVGPGVLALGCRSDGRTTVMCGKYGGVAETGCLMAMLVLMGTCAGQHCIMLWCCRYSARQRRRFRFRVAVVFVRVFVFVLFLVVDLTWIGWNHAEETFGP